MTIFSTREWATLIWGSILFLYIFLNVQTREAFGKVIKIFFSSKLRILWEIIFLYVLVITVIFYQLPFWNNIYIKDIVIWFVFSGLLYCMNAVSRESDESYIRKVLKDNLKLTIIMEFIISTFTFNIWIELVIIPSVTIIVMLNTIAEQEEKYKSVHKLLDGILAVAGFWVLYEAVKIGIKEYKELNLLNSFVSFMIPIVYLILIIPLEYALELYSKYELMFLRMSFKEEKNKKVRRSHRWKLIEICKFSVHRVLLFQRKYCAKMYCKISEEEFIELLEKFRKECMVKNTNG